MGIFKKRTNKKFTYTPRHYKGDGEGSPFEIKHKFDGYRKTVGPNSGLKGKFKNALEELKENKENPDHESNRRILIIVIILILIFLIIIDFDLTIFFSK